MRVLFFVLALIITLVSCDVSESYEEIEYTDTSIDTTLVSQAENELFGISLEDYSVHFDTVQSGWTLSHLLLPFGIDQYSINKTDALAKDSVVNLNYIVAGKPFTVFTLPEDTLRKAQYVVYEPDVFSYIVFDFTSDSIDITKQEKEVEIQKRWITGEIAQNSNLSAELAKNFDSYNLTAALADAMESIYAWSIDFFKLQVGDQFIVAFEEKTIDGKPYGIKDIEYAWFNHSGKGKYAFLFTTDSVEQIRGYYDEEGREMKRPFLMAPVKFARISSGYSANRFHPVYKTNKPHLGTDYAAPTGTPIMATSDGTVTKATRSGANGIFVKLRHNATYETQYLHMSRIADGIRPGVRVEQGQTIGYVGQTGAATGPHVCYRFWKNGKQINHRAEKFPNSEPMEKSLIPSYLEYISPKKERINQLISSSFEVSHEVTAQEELQ